jgi:hypothetical protein
MLNAGTPAVMLIGAHRPIASCCGGNRCTEHFVHLWRYSAPQLNAGGSYVTVEEHQKTVLLLQWEIGSGQNAPLQKFAAETLSTVVAHLRRAQFIASELTGQTPPEIAPRMSSTSDQPRGAPSR